MNWFYLHDLDERLLILLLALIVAGIATGPLGLYKTLRLDRPGKMLRRFVEKAEKKLNRENRSAGKRVYRGMILTLFISLSLATMALAITHLSAHWYYGDIVEIAILAALIPLRHIWDQSRKVASLLKNNHSAAANGYVDSFSRRAPKQHDDHALCRIAIEHMMENLSDKVVAPILAYLLLGLPGAIFIRTINVMDGVIGHRSDRYLAFGWCAAKLDDLLQFIPARITALMIIIASIFIPKCHPLKALITVVKDRKKMRSPNSGWPLAASAGALHISLGGARKRGDTTVDDGWLGQGSAKATLHDLRRALVLYIACSLLIILALAATLSTSMMTIPTF